jgi:hypothetical protein
MAEIIKEMRSSGGGEHLPLSFLTTRFFVSETDPPYFPPPYSSLLADVRALNQRHLEMDKLRQNALHPVKLQAGKANMPGGELGRHSARNPILVPEMLGGRVLTTNV